MHSRRFSFSHIIVRQYAGISIVMLFLVTFPQAFSFQSTPSIDFESYDPISTLVVPNHNVSRASIPFIDVHNHRWDVPNEDLNTLRLQMDSMNMGIMVNLSGRGFKRSGNDFDVNDGEYLKKSIRTAKNQGMTRKLVFFTNVSFSHIGEPW